MADNAATPLVTVEWLRRELLSENLCVVDGSWHLPAFERDPKKEYENVFKPFYRIDKSRSLNKSGVGLGLSIAQDIIRSHGGNIALSESKHKGLLVKISLPL